MNETELKAFEWLQAQGYDKIIYQHRNSPDFLTVDGLGWETKKLRHSAIVFSTTQISNLKTHPSVTVLVFNEDDKVMARIPFDDISSPPCFWKTIRIVLVDFHKYRPVKEKSASLPLAKGGEVPRIKVDPKQAYPRPYWPQELKIEGFVGDMLILNDAVTATILHPKATLEQAKKSLEIVILDLDLRIEREREDKKGE